ncbi:MAG: hypothetical protein HFJ86_07850 [Oscillospiraceae bacterium]|nr:hypothetical protein [Oscillospiraceae bacterium]
MTVCTRESSVCRDLFSPLGEEGRRGLSWASSCFFPKNTKSTPFQLFGFAVLYHYTLFPAKGNASRPSTNFHWDRLAKTMEKILANFHEKVGRNAGFRQGFQHLLG